MKKSILIAAVLFLTAIGNSFANKTIDDVDSNVRTAFNRDFANANDIHWENNGSVSKATFTVNGQVVTAFYSKSGELMGITRNLLSSQLPISQLVSLNKNYRNYWISDLFEMNAENETSYYITLENADYKLVLRSVDNNDWELYSKRAK